MKRYFSFDPEQGIMEFHDTQEEAEAAAKKDLQWATDGDIGENVSGICWGEIKGSAVETSHQTVEELETSDPLMADHCRKNGWDFLSTYEIEDVK